MIAGIGAAVGLGIGVALVGLFEYRNRSVRCVEDVSPAGGVGSEDGGWTLAGASAGSAAAGGAA